MTHRPRVRSSTGRTYAPLVGAETSGAMETPRTPCLQTMKASDSSTREGNSVDGSTEYDREERLWRFIDDHTDILADMAHQAKPANDRRVSGAEDLEHAAERWRGLAREAAFYADVIDELRPEEDGEDE